MNYACLLIVLFSIIGCSSGDEMSHDKGARPDIPHYNPAIPVDLIMPMGQSNSGNTNGVADPAGVANVAAYLQAAYNSTSLTNPITPDPNVGVHPRLATLALAAGRNPILVRHFQNATFISQWQEGQALGDQILVARATGETLARDGRYWGPAARTRAFIIWIHGESDGGDAGLAAAYEGALRTRANAWDVSLGNPITIVVGLHSGFSSVTHRATIRAAQEAVVAERPWRFIVNPNAITDHNGLHYTTPGYTTLANLIAVPYLAAATVR